MLRVNTFSWLPVLLSLMLASPAWAESAVAESTVIEGPDKMTSVPSAPLYRDPVFAGAADPTIFYNHKEQQWWMIYTQRRANAENTHKLSWVHGTQIGVASSDDGGITWKYRGTLPLALEPGHNTYWAPDIFWHDGNYHLFVTFVQGIPVEDYDDEHRIAYLKGKDPWSLKFVNYVDVGSNRIIDPSVVRLDDGTWRLWYKAENSGYVTHYADSKNLKTWTHRGPAIGDKKCEGANVFQWKGKFWMVTDPWKGLDVFSSPDAKNWTFVDTILVGKGQRQDDSGKGHHADVYVSGEKAYIFYHVNPEESFGPDMDWSRIGFRQRRSVVQVAELVERDGKLHVIRNKPFNLDLKVPQR